MPQQYVTSQSDKARQGRELIAGWLTTYSEEQIRQAIAKARAAKSDGIVGPLYVDKVLKEAVKKRAAGDGFGESTNYAAGW